MFFLEFIVELFVVHLCELEDVVGATAPRSGQNQKHQVHRVHAPEVEDEESGEEADEHVDELPDEEYEAGLEALTVVDFVFLKDAHFDAQISNDLVHGVPWILCYISEGGDKLRVLVDHFVLNVQVGGLPQAVY